MTVLGVVFLPQLPPERLRGIARAADHAGLEELWLWEDCFSESAFSAAAAALAWTSRLRVGIGLLPVPLRNPALTAMEVATLLRLFPGRADVGVGHGVQSWMAQVGARVDSPLTLLREYLGALRDLLEGREVTTRGRYVSLDAVALAWPPSPPPPLLVGAAGPRTLRLAGESADGTILTGGTSPESLRRARDLVDEGRRAAGRTGPHRVVVYLHAATGPDAAVRLEAERVRWGHASLEGIAVQGDAERMADGLRPLLAAGADTVVLQPTPDDPDPEGFVRFVAEEVRPLLP
ncbi:MAG: LLM class flavin-dependent oxidoreductase [Actinomycetales bacterium]|nr:LLM class flavin-dependent oxidoreductase [Actinomycetales bacterium]